MFYLKACRKCHGDVYVSRDQYGTFLECVQCGSIVDVKLSDEFNAAGQRGWDVVHQSAQPQPLQATA